MQIQLNLFILTIFFLIAILSVYIILLAIQTLTFVSAQIRSETSTKVSTPSGTIPDFSSNQETTGSQFDNNTATLDDIDNDHILNFPDKCPLIAEGKNLYNKSDGCPNTSLEELISSANAWLEFEKWQNNTWPVKATITGSTLSLENTDNVPISSLWIKVKQGNKTQMQLPLQIESAWTIDRLTNDTYILYPKTWTQEHSSSKGKQQLLYPNQSINLTVNWDDLLRVSPNSTTADFPSKNVKSSEQIIEILAIPPYERPGGGGSIHPIGIRIIEDYPLTPHEKVTLEGRTLNLDPRQPVWLYITGPTGFPLFPYFTYLIEPQLDGRFSLTIDPSISPYYSILSEREFTGQYNVFVQQGNIDASAQFEIIFPRIQIHTDKQFYALGDSVTISTFVSNTSTRQPDFRIGIFPPGSDDLIYFNTLKPDISGKASVTLPSKIFTKCGQYEIMVAYGAETFSQFFGYYVNCKPTWESPSWGCHWMAGHPPPDCTPTSGEVKRNIQAPDGQVYPVLTSVDEDGNPIEVQFVQGIRKIVGVDEYPPACRGPDVGLYQEGMAWQTRPDLSTIGLSQKWKMPNISAVSASNFGIWFNPVNFGYKGPDPGVSQFYNFFQVDFGIGNNGITNGWQMTGIFTDENANTTYDYNVLEDIPIIPGKTYKVDAILSFPPLSSSPAFVAQITPEGGKGYIGAILLDYLPGIGTQQNIKALSSYTDQYIQSEGKATSDISAYYHTPRLLKWSGNAITEDRTGITGFSIFDFLSERSRMYKTIDILSPLPLSSFSYYDHLDCTSWTFPTPP